MIDPRHGLGSDGSELEAVVVRATDVPRLAKPARQAWYARSFEDDACTLANRAPATVLHDAR